MTYFDSLDGESRRTWLDQVNRDISLRPNAFRVAWRICQYVNSRRWNDPTWPSLELMAALMGACTRTVIRAVKALEERGHLEVTRSLGVVNGYKLVKGSSLRT